MHEDSGYRLRLIEHPGEIAAADWDGLTAADPDANVFLSHAYLKALHESGAATAATGWLGRYLTLWRAQRLEAAVPLYVKSHSYGEYVFDWAWADAQERSGLPYYPKWLVAVPFTPVGGSRLLAIDETARQAVAGALLSLVQENDLSSLHVLFAPLPQARLLAHEGMLLREGVQFHWRNAGYADFDHFLDTLAQPKRKKIRAERRKVAEAGVRLERRTGPEITPHDWEFFVRCYENTYAEHGAPPYLNLDFFLALGRDLPGHMMLVTAWRGPERIASALGVFDERQSALYGRYWGALERVSCLHFECCYYQMIEFAIERRLASFEGGAQGAHKLARGLDPVRTLSAHWLREPQMHDAVARFLTRERASVGQTIDELNEHRARRECAGALPRPGED